MKATDKASHLAHEAGDKIAGAAHQAADAISEKGEQMKHAEQRLVKNCCGYVRGNPLTSLALSAAAGFLLGRLWPGR